MGADGGKNPNFNQSLYFDVHQQPYVLSVEVWEDDPLKDDFMASTLVEFKQALERGSHSATYPLRGKHGE